MWGTEVFLPVGRGERWKAVQLPIQSNVTWGLLVLFVCLDIVVVLTCFVKTLWLFQEILGRTYHLRKWDLHLRCVQIAEPALKRGSSPRDIFCFPKAGLPVIFL